MKILLLISLITCVNFAIAQDKKIDNSITIHNLSDSEQNIWINAVSYNVSFNSSLRVPCNQDETIEVQYIDESVNLSCGSKKEIK